MTEGERGFKEAYAGLNPEQKRAVDAIEGPVMVVAGPGTGKTQVLALRIANILEKTDTPANGILCLTFTRAGVKAMRERLSRYIGVRATEARISTFHQFAIDLVERYYTLLDFDEVPNVLDDARAVALIDELLETKNWLYLRPRGDVAKYFGDLRNLVSLMKRERVTPEQFRSSIDEDITILKESPDSISSRGETKGKFKKEVEKKIDGLQRTKEVISFYEQYEALKRERSLMDYDDSLEYAVRLVEENEDIRSELRENYLYVLIDEHQDSSGVQNAFLKAVWKETEVPNIFVVGDDRQLIYGFGGASLDYFEEFKTAFGEAQRIILVENYRSTSPILSLADNLLQSSLTKEKLRSNLAGTEKVKLYEYDYERDEIIAAGLHFKETIRNGTPAEECALLVPKNRQIRTAVNIFRDLGIPVRSFHTISLFSIPETESFRNVLRIIADPFDAVALTRSVFDVTSSIPPLVAHAFLRQIKVKDLSVETLCTFDVGDTLFAGQHPVVVWGNKLSSWISRLQQIGFERLIHEIGNELLIDIAPGYEALMHNIEVLRTMIHLVENFLGEYPKATLKDFLQYLDRLETYGHTIPVATLLGGEGVSVLTLHGSKGLEFDTVWIAHMNENVLMSHKRLNFMLPKDVESLVEERDRMVATREVYVAITRAKAHCTISYARTGVMESGLELAHLLQDLPPQCVEEKFAEETERELVATNPKLYVAKPTQEETCAVDALKTLVANEYTERKVSVTLLNNFYECPWKWYFRNLLQLPELKSEYQLFGSAVHSALEQLLKGELSTDTKAIQNAVTSYLEKEGVIERATLRRLGKEGTDAVCAWVQASFEHIAPDHTAERSLSYRDPTFPDLSMYGKIDLTERFSDGTIAVTDFKTGSAKTKGAIEKRDEQGRLSSHLRQLAMYSYLIQGVEKRDVTTSKLLYIEESPKDKNALYATHIDAETIDLLKRDIKEYQDALQSGDWVTRPCNFTSYGTNKNVCEYCAMAQRIGISKKM